MQPDADEFVAEGMKRYKQAALMLVAFGEEVETSLRMILDKPRDWGGFSPAKEAQAKSTTYWSKYPLLNAKMDGDFNGKSIKMVIGVDWYESDSEYPFYAVWIEPADAFEDNLRQFDWNAPFQYKKKSLRYLPDPEDFDLSRDFDHLLEEFSRFFRQ